MVSRDEGQQRKWSARRRSEEDMVNQEDFSQVVSREGDSAGLLQREITWFLETWRSSVTWLQLQVHTGSKETEGNKNRYSKPNWAAIWSGDLILGF